MQAILFDVDGVLVHGYTGQAERRRRWDQYMSDDLGIDPDAFTELFIKGVFERDVLTGRKALVAALQETLPALGFFGPPLVLASYWLTRDSQLNYRLIDIARRLRRRPEVKLYIATNQEHMRAFHLWNHLGLQSTFDDIFYSARFGVLKPNKHFFEQIINIIGTQTNPPLIIDDSQSVIASAKEFGWHGLYYERLEDCLSDPLIAELLT